MEKPRIYGDESRLRAAVTRAINSGEDLLAQTEGVRRMIEAASDQRGEARGEPWAIEQAWVADFRRWFNRTGQSLHKFLREQLIGVPRWMRAPGMDSKEEDVMPIFGAGLPPDTGKPRHTIHLDEAEEWLRGALDELRELQSVLPPPKRAARREAEAPAPDRPGWMPSWWKLGTAGSIASLVGVALGIAAIVLAVLWH
jgi:hypothetical protein